MYTNNEKLNNLGIVVGILYRYIPFYLLYKYIKTFKMIKSYNSIYIMSIINFILNIIMIVTTLIITVLLLQSKSLGLISTLFIILLVAILVLQITIGIKTKKLLENELNVDNRFEIAKFAGINLFSIPFYKVAKLMLSYDLIKSLESNLANNVIIYCILVGLVYLGLGIFIPIFLVILIVAVRFANILSTYQNKIVDMEDCLEQKEQYQNFKSF